MYTFPKQSLKYQVIEISRKSRKMGLPRKIQSREARLQNLRPHWIRGVEMSTRGVSDLDFESLHIKRGKDFNCQFIVYLEKRNSLKQRLQT